MPDGEPDECDPCGARNDGAYCGTELGWGTKTANLLVHCSNHAVVASPGPQVCTNPCASGSGNGTAHCP
jgi:hypothetical protein